MRLLQRPQDHGHVLEAIELALERQHVRGQALLDDAEGFGKLPWSLRRIHAEKTDLNWRDTAPHAQLETAAAHVIEHADFLDQAQRMIERQQIDQWSEA